MGKITKIRRAEQELSVDWWTSGRSKDMDRAMWRVVGTPKNRVRDYEHRVLLDDVITVFDALNDGGTIPSAIRKNISYKLKLYLRGNEDWSRVRSLSTHSVSNPLDISEYMLGGDEAQEDEADDMKHSGSNPCLDLRGLSDAEASAALERLLMRVDADMGSSSTSSSSSS